MRKFQAITILTIVVLSLSLNVINGSTNAALQHAFRIKEYELFHDVLHPLQHEALPKQDFQRIRSHADELVRRGKAIVKLGVPEAPKANRRNFANALRKFNNSLARFKGDARSGSNSKLNASFVAVHDSFETLADLVPTVYPGGMPPMIRIHCPSDNAEAGSNLTFTADSPDAGGLLFTWSVSAGKIVSGDGTSTITVNTNGLAGQTLSVSVEVNDRFGFVVMADCNVQLAAAKPE